MDNQEDSLRKYAVINDEGIPECIYWLDINGIYPDNFILIDDDFDPNHKKYVNDEWIEYHDPAEYIVDEKDEMVMEMAMNVQYILDLMEINEEV